MLGVVVFLTCDRNWPLPGPAVPVPHSTSTDLQIGDDAAAVISEMSAGRERHHCGVRCMRGGNALGPPTRYGLLLAAHAGAKSVSIASASRSIAVSHVNI